MAEPLSWLKLGPRARTPTDPLAAHPLEAKGARDSQPHDLLHPGSRRISSSNPPEDGFQSASTDDSADKHHIFVRDEDQVWYNPSLDQMVEALQVRLMQRGLFEPLPVQYNSYVSYLIEGFVTAQQKIRDVEAAHEVTKLFLEQNLEQSRQMASHWFERESQYQSEVKRLEVLLAQCSESGLEAVTLARANSLVDCSGSKDIGPLSQLTRSRMANNISPREITRPAGQATVQESRPGEGSRVVVSNDYEKIAVPRILDNKNDFRISQKLRQQDAAARHGGGKKDYRHQVSQPEFRVRNRYQDDSYNQSLGVQDVPKMTNIRQGKQPPVNTGKRYEESVGGPERSHCQRDHSISPVESLSSLAAYFQGSEHDFGRATPKITTANRHKRCESDFSFKAGDDLDAIPNNDTRGEKGEVESSLATERYRSSSSDSDGPATIFDVTKAQTPQKKRNELDIQSSPCSPHIGALGTPKVSVRRCKNAAQSGRYATVGARPVQNNRSLDPILVTATADQEITRSRTTETEAQIAARHALTKVLDTRKQKK